MKIRQGFVSNSSSSSFMLIGKKVNIMEVSNSDIEDKTFVTIGKPMGDGSDIFYIDTIQMLWFVKTAQKIDFNIDWFDGFDVYETFEPNHRTEEEIKFNSKDLPEGELTASSWWMDYSSSKTVGDLFDKYFYDNETNLKEFDTVYARYQRKQKLNNIEKNV